MKIKNELSRITVDIPKIDHKKLKAMAALTSRSMREIIVASIEEYLSSAKNPNKVTLKAIEDAEKGKGLTASKDVKDLFKKLGI
jgi:hypothetical protein